MGVEEFHRHVAPARFPRLVIDATAVPLGGDFIEVVSPFKEHTTVGKLLDKRGDGGFMIIMQTEDAKKRREYITANKLASVIFDHEFSDSVCIQYHPKGIKGTFVPWPAWLQAQAQAQSVKRRRRRGGGG